MKNLIVKRFKEPSTWAGLSAIALAFGINPEHVNAVSQAGIAVFGALAVFIGEGGN